MVPRGRVELPTPAFSGPRSTGELPRHRYSKRFYGKGATLERENRPMEIATEARRHRGKTENRASRGAFGHCSLATPERDSSTNLPGSTNRRPGSPLS
jgi:hypothetical protein